MLATDLGFDQDRLRFASYHLLDRLIVGLEELLQTQTNWAEDAGRITPTVTAAVAPLKFHEIVAVLHQLNRTRMQRVEVRSVQDAEDAIRSHLVREVQGRVHTLWGKWQKKPRRGRPQRRF